MRSTMAAGQVRVARRRHLQEGAQDDLGCAQRLPFSQKSKNRIRDIVMGWVECLARTFPHFRVCGCLTGSSRVSRRDFYSALSGDTTTSSATSTPSTPDTASCLKLDCVRTDLHGCFHNLVINNDKVAMGPVASRGYHLGPAVLHALCELTNLIPPSLAGASRSPTTATVVT